MYVFKLAMIIFKRAEWKKKVARKHLISASLKLLHLFDFWHSVMIFHRGRVFNCIGKKLRASCEWLPATRLRVRGLASIDSYSVETSELLRYGWSSTFPPSDNYMLTFDHCPGNTCWFCESKKSQILIFIAIKRSAFCSCCDRLAGLWKNGDHGELVSPQGVQETCRRRHRTDYQRSGTTIGSSSPSYQKIKIWSKPIES